MIQIMQQLKNSWRNGVTYRQMDKYEESLADLNKSLEIDPNNATALNNHELTNRQI